MAQSRVAPCDAALCVRRQQPTLPHAGSTGIGTKASQEHGPSMTIVRNPTIDTLLRIAVALEVDLADVLRRAQRAAVRDHKSSRKDRPKN